MDAEFEARLSAYLDAPVAGLKQLASGWETTVSEFSLPAPSQRVAAPAGLPLVLRFYQGNGAAAKGTREHAAMVALAAAGFPVATPYLFETDPAPLGAPFMVMDRLAGGPLLQLGSFSRAVRVFTMAFPAFVRTHVRLHRLDTAGSRLGAIEPGLRPANVSPRAPLLERVLATIEQRVAEGPLPWLQEPLMWARERAHRFAVMSPSLLHLDYHPLNAMVLGRRVTGIIDWVNAEIGDRHLDVAMTSAILSSTAMDQPKWLDDNASGRLLRGLYGALYFASYHAMAPLDLRRLHYYQAVAAMLRLSTMGMMHRRGPESVGYRAHALREVTPAVMRLLARFASRKCGLPLFPSGIAAAG